MANQYAPPPKPRTDEPRVETDSDYQAGEQAKARVSAWLASEPSEWKELYAELAERRRARAR